VSEESRSPCGLRVIEKIREYAARGFGDRRFVRGHDFLRKKIPDHSLTFLAAVFGTHRKTRKYFSQFRSRADWRSQTVPIGKGIVHSQKGLHMSPEYQTK
jgi:hypothetical protein